MTGVRPGGLAVLALDLVVLFVFASRPVRRPCTGDRGDGLTEVVLPRPRRVRLTRIAAFYAVAAAVSALVVGVRPDGPATLYRDLVVRLALLVVNRPVAVNGYADHLDPDIAVVVGANIIAFAAVIHASMLRRLAVMWNAVIFLLLAVSLETVGVLIGIAFHLPTGPTTLTAQLFLVVAALLVVVRIMMTTFQLPRPTAVPLAPRTDRRRGNVIMLAGTVIGTVVMLGIIDLLNSVVAPAASGGLVLIFGFPLVYDAVLAFLFVAAPRVRRPVTTARPPLTTITPAFNEEAVIRSTLAAIDRAAVRYGGTVTAIVVDDGSTDTTRAVIREAMEDLVAAKGILVEADHGGKSRALNTGLGVATTELVIRIDADTIVAEDAFVHVPGWFEDPVIGMVGALDLPNPQLRSWYAQGRLFECLTGFAFARNALQRLDAINCVPGTFMAFRADAARSVGGFVSGMNGEDSDLTMLIGRIGYHVTLDTRIRIYEDVPGDLNGFREQRTRWNRAGVQNLARHSPLIVGPGGAREWFFFARAAKIRTTAVLRPLVFVTGLELALLNPASGSRLVFIGVAYVVSAIPTFVILSCLAVWFGFARKLPWLAIWFPFTLVRRLIALEALLTLPTRPVRLPGGADERLSRVENAPPPRREPVSV